MGGTRGRRGEGDHCGLVVRVADGYVRYPTVHQNGYGRLDSEVMGDGPRGRRGCLLVDEQARPRVVLLGRVHGVVEQRARDVRQERPGGRIEGEQAILVRGDRVGERGLRPPCPRTPGTRTFPPSSCTGNDAPAAGLPSG